MDLCLCVHCTAETIFFSLWDTGFQTQWLICSQKCLGLLIKYRNKVHQGPLSSSYITSSLSGWNYDRNWYLVCKLLMLVDFWPQLHWGSKTEWSLRCLSWETFTSYSIQQPCLCYYADPVSSFTTPCRVQNNGLTMAGAHYNISESKTKRVGSLGCHVWQNTVV